MTYLCPACGSSVASWLINKQHFNCPECNSLITSNRAAVFKNSLVVALTTWFFVLICFYYYYDSLLLAAVASIEVGGILAGILATLYYRLTIHLKKAQK